jgi:hypothetical protein
MAARYNLRSRLGYPYTYSPLDRSRPTIRLLEILPNSTKGQLSLAIKHVSLAEAKQQYHTISYTWGNDEPSHRVYINSQYLLLRDSIFSFLMHCYGARSSLPKWFWIDSICINQSDINEKNQQVPIMGQIFRDSYGTLIWLDKLSTKGSFATSFQTYWSTIPRNLDDEQESQYLNIFLYGSTDLKVKKKRKTIRQDVIHLFNHNYWRRLWVVQEIILSQRISIILGHITVNLDLILRSLYDSIPYHQRNISGLFEDRYLDYTLQRLCTNRMGGVEDRQSFGLLSLVSEYKAHGCKDIRDRVYGLLALTYMSDRVTVDYNCHVVALFAETLRYCVAGLEDFGPRRENIHMYDVQNLMQALSIYPNVLFEYQNQKTTDHNFTHCFKLAMFPTVVYIVTPHHSDPVFMRLIDANDKSIDLNLSICADSKRDLLHTKILAEICHLCPHDTEARYLLCHLPLSGFETLIRVPAASDIILVGTVEYTGKQNMEGNLVTPCPMPAHILHNINVELNNSRYEFRRAAYDQKVEWPGYVIRCSIEELVSLQGSHDRLDPEHSLVSEQ